ncbi:MAG: putative baseplate assembly protein [Chloroflexi bacterium]|nr:putative baseplate assembly protein [Chloroflexota bacterium]
MTIAGSTCGCCSGVAGRTPGAVHNRPGLSSISYRVGRHGDFLDSMIAGLTDVERPRLADLTTRDSDDVSIAVLDAWAVVSDVLTFYTERLANESYLRTAGERISLQELGRLIGYRLRPGVAAETHLAFAIEPPPEVPAAASRDPGANPNVTPTSVVLDAGLRVQSIPAPGEQPQTFETVEEIEARATWNAMPARATKVQLPGMGDTSAYLQGVALNLKAGDGLLIAGGDVLTDHWDLRILAAVQPQPEHDRTLVTWLEPLGSAMWGVTPATPPVPFAMRKRLNVFGHNAPMWGSLSLNFRDNYPGGLSSDGTTRASDWPNFTIADIAGNVVDLDGSHPDIQPESWIVLSMPTYRELWQVTSVSELARAEFAVSGKVTRLALEGGENYDLFDELPREVTVFAASEPLAFAEGPDPSNVANASVDVRVDVSEMRPGRRLIVRGTTTAGAAFAEAATVLSVAAIAGGWRLTLDGDLASAYARDSVVVHGNVALGTRGETVRQLLGSGRAATAFQRFTLAHDPLTYLQSTDPSGATAALEVRVNDVRWDEVSTLYATGPADRAYAVRGDELGRTYVQFGDGARGTRLPSGSGNVRAKYRKGLGGAGNVGSDALAQLLDRPLGVKGVTNPVPASGGVDPEAESAARASMPLGVRTLGRAVSLLDYEDFARAFAGVAKAHAAVLPLRGGRTIVVTVALSGVPAAQSAERLGDLADALRSHGDPQVQVSVLAGSMQAFRVGMRVAIDPAYEADAVIAKVEAALRNAFAFDARSFTDPVYRSGVTAVVHTVAGVLALDIDALYMGTTSDLADRLLAQQPAVGGAGTAIPAGLLILDPAPLDKLEAMA